MVELADIFRQYGPAYRAKFGERMPASHLKAMAAIEQCRTEALGGHVYHCETCDETLYSYHSCPGALRARHCPKCQHDAAQAWLEKQQQFLLPVPYFMVTFTLPAALHPVARSYQKLVYDRLFRTAAAALQQLTQDPRFVGGKIGMVGILQTWTRDLRYHPHLHFLVPGGGLSADGETWMPSKHTFLVHAQPLSILFRAKFRAALKLTALFAQVPAQTWAQVWVVDCRPVGSGAAALKYLGYPLGAYVFRVAISHSRILKLADDQVTFTYKEGGSGKPKRCTLPAEQLIQRFL
jgi:Putative transposase/Transposase zinc-binding domain